MAKDPVCEVEVVPAKAAASSVFNGETLTSAMLDAKRSSMQNRALFFRVRRVPSLRMRLRILKPRAVKT